VEQRTQDRYKTRSQIVFETLKDEIMLGAILPGTVLDQEEIAARFQVSRIPVREALRMLAMERTVELRPHHRAVVRKFSTGEIEDLFLIRSILEPKAGAMACGHIQSADLATLRDLLGRMEPLNRSDDLVQYLQLNRAFHMGIYRLAGSTILETLIAHYIDQSSRFIHIYLKATETFAKAHIDHLEIYRACEARDGIVLAQLIEAHVRQTLAVLHESVFQSLRA
jgi:DNA-binding GntR family transcriptional regulator